ncbi:MAG: hypothetical protein LBR33_00070, partial [Propionibacteriaceae bacterium]|nr:hypothetical protein [Propionibacteriaceae bacterium]
MTESPPATPDWSVALLWDSILSHLDPPTRALVATCKPLAVGGQYLHVAAPNDFTRDRIEQRLHERIEEVAAAQAGRDLKLRVSIDPSLQEGVLRTPAPSVTPPVTPDPAADVTVKPPNGLV